MRHALGSSYRHDLSCGDLFHSAGLVARVIIEFVCFPHPMLYSLRELKENDTYIFSTTFLFLEASLRAKIYQLTSASALRSDPSSTPSLNISSGAVMTSTVIGIRSPTITCPACVGKTHRSTRHGLRDFCYRLVGFYPFRCWDCGHRFYRCRRR